MNGDDFANQSLIGCNPKLGLCPMHLDENCVKNYRAFINQCHGLLSIWF